MAEPVKPREFVREIEPAPRARRRTPVPRRARKAPVVAGVTVQDSESAVRARELVRAKIDEELEAAQAYVNALRRLRERA